MEMKKLSEEEVESLPKDIIIKLFMSMQSSVESLEATIKLLSEQIKIMNQRSFGRSTEKQSSRIFEQLEQGRRQKESGHQTSRRSRTTVKNISNYPKKN